MVGGDLNPPTTQITGGLWVHSKVTALLVPPHMSNRSQNVSVMLTFDLCAALWSHPEELPELPHQTENRDHFSLRHHLGIITSCCVFINKMSYLQLKLFLISSACRR